MPFINNAEGMASGTAIAADQTGSGDPFDAVVIAGTPTGTYSNAQAAHGAKSYHIAGDTSDQITLRYQGVSEVDSAVRMYIRFVSLPSAATNMFEIRDTGGGQNAAFGISGGGKLQIKNAVGTAVHSFANTPALNTWYRFELQAGKGGTTTDGMIAGAYYIGDSTTPAETAYSSSTVNAGTLNMSSLRIGKIVTATTFGAYFDDIAWDYSSASPLGPVGSTSNQVPTVSAGVNQTGIEPYAVRTLNGTDSDDGTIVTRTWRQISGTSVTLTGSGNTRTYTAPGTISGTTLVFGYKVVDDEGATSAEDTVSHTILPATERAVINGVEVPMETNVVIGGELV